MKSLLVLIASLLIALCLCACDREAEAGGEVESGTDAEAKTATHRITHEAVYYLTSPQQASPPDGNLAEGTEVELLENSGSYVRVRTADGIEAYVSVDSIEPLD